jgi:hypothetical protein
MLVLRLRRLCLGTGRVRESDFAAWASEKALGGLVLCFLGMMYYATLRFASQVHWKNRRIMTCMFLSCSDRFLTPLYKVSGKAAPIGL